MLHFLTSVSLGLTRYYDRVFNRLARSVRDSKSRSSGEGESERKALDATRIPSEPTSSAGETTQVWGTLCLTIDDSDGNENLARPGPFGGKDTWLWLDTREQSKKELREVFSADCYF